MVAKMGTLVLHAWLESYKIWKAFCSKSFLTNLYSLKWGRRNFYFCFQFKFLLTLLSNHFILMKKLQLFIVVRESNFVWFLWLSCVYQRYVVIEVIVLFSFILVKGINSSTKHSRFYRKDEYLDCMFILFSWITYMEEINQL